MGKPREFWISPEFNESWDYNPDSSEVYSKEAIIHVIEKSAADKLAEALDAVIKVSDRKTDVYDSAKQALAEYRGEK